jgi:hypothetical protein
MIILNTTFIVEDARMESFLRWARETYLPALRDANIFTDATMAKVMAQLEPGTSSVAIQAKSPDLEAATRWHDETAAMLKDDLSARFEGKALFFTTYMDVIE